MIENGEIFEAYDILVSIGDYKDSAEKADSIIDGLNIGNHICFGNYEQDGNKENGKEPIEWRVIGKEGKKVLLISQKALDFKPYNKDDTDVTWDTCTLRSWLNKGFYNSTFSAGEKSKIIDAGQGKVFFA